MTKPKKQTRRQPKRTRRRKGHSPKDIYVDEHCRNMAEMTGETPDEVFRRLVDEDDLPGHRG